MSVNLSPIGGAAAQFFDNNGNPLSGGKLYTYAAGTTTPLATYTTSVGNVAHTNPIIFDSAGRVPGGQIWLTDGNINYKFLLETSTSVLVGTFDNIPTAVSGTAAEIVYLPAGTGAVATTAQAKLRESVSVLDFMTTAQVASCQARDGTDVTAAVLLARNKVMLQGGSLYFPTGSYVIDDTALQNLSMVTLFGAGCGSNIAGGATRLILKAGIRTSLIATSLNARSVHIADMDLEGLDNATAGVTGFYINGGAHCTYQRLFIRGFIGTAGTPGRGVNIFAPALGQGYFNKGDTCLIRQCGHGIEGTFENGTNAPNLNTFINVAIDACISHGVLINGNSTYGWQFLGGQSSFNGGDGYNLDGLVHTLLGATFEGNTGYGVRNNNGSSPNLFILPGQLFGLNIAGEYLNCAPGMTVAFPDTVKTATLVALNNNNYEPGVVGLPVLRLSGNADGTSTITGFQARDGNQRITLINVSAFNFTVDHQSAGSNIANRIITPDGASLTVAANDSMELWYDTLSARWRVINFTV